MSLCTHISCLALAGLTCLPAFAQPYRCTVNGATVYQQAPCVGGAAVNTSGAGTANLSSPAAMQVQREIAAIKRKERGEQAILEGKAFVGMTTEELLLSWGQPTKINTTLTKNGKRQQWIYDRGKIGYTQYVYVEGGEVTTIQSPE